MITDAVYVSDRGDLTKRDAITHVVPPDSYISRVSEDDFNETSRGWAHADPDAPLPFRKDMGLRPRHVVGASADNSVRGSAIVARPDADLWRGYNAGGDPVSTFQIRRRDGTQVTLHVTGYVGESFTVR